MSSRRSEKKKANGLVALGSAAVLAVYSAGYFKTKAAAERLQELESRVRPGMSVERPATPLMVSAPVPPPVAAPVPVKPVSKVAAPIETAPFEPPPETKASPPRSPYRRLRRLQFPRPSR